MNSVIQKKGTMIIIGIATILLIMGIKRGEVLVVMEKATGVCLECIGLG